MNLRSGDLLAVTLTMSGKNRHGVLPPAPNGSSVRHYAMPYQRNITPVRESMILTLTMGGEMGAWIAPLPSAIRRPTMTDLCLCAGTVWLLVMLVVVFFVWCPIALSSRRSEEERKENDR